MVWLLGCNTDAQEWRCIGPLIELVKWRDGVESDRIFANKVVPDLEAQEKARVDAAVAALTPYRGECEMTWSLLLFQEADNPALVLRERAVHTLMEAK